MSSEWRVSWTKSVEKAYKKHPDKERFKRIIAKLKTDPVEGPNIKPLIGELKGLYRYRFSNMRLVYKLDKRHKMITLIYFGSRGDAYR